MAAALLVPSSATAKPNTDPSPATCDGHSLVFHQHRARVLLQRAYDSDHSEVDTSAIKAAQTHRRCIHINEVRLALGTYRDKLKRKYEAARFQREYLPFEGPDGNHYAIPYIIVWCETQVTNANPYGYYALVDWDNSHWGAHEFAPTAAQATFEEQSIVARRMYLELKATPWDPSKDCWGGRL